ncbi:zf-ZPR1-domain-containing protein [Saitoella complicata NRRL Y-17804]|uniref:Zinc finger ZPR1-type domain-containing protein n=1 Tax=Saitoella complicata (strain BCRC 22490 / CBS 7301 / JCM 7358 / NBRC 10748 / NRRL Y-17804) TaxID=698492 RepID=A0A0E9NI24_SAICN|nr:zf-ZPR1-domain-containing protein [Saitoella complicata NRRL Y-17804]ODQ52078.1 zf-ZPR1-domain-containing protein [Saitoella complicata NRRL Y-17804]GAO49453.1 hypothetical protein G7K_3603-t1 [Saitoella complicata NRRL Y-17804]
MADNENKPVDIFQDVGEAAENVTDNNQVVQEIESLCMQCHEQGMTRLLLTRIPFFKEVVLMSFACPHCGFRNSEIQNAGVIQPRGCIQTLQVTSKGDLDRQVVKSETCSSTFVELDLEIPPQRGQLTTVEGLLSTVLEDLDADQPARKDVDPETYEKIAAFIQKGRDMLEGRAFPFILRLNDPAGNSWIEPQPGDPQTKWSRVEYDRTPEQNQALGLANPEEGQQDDDDIRPDEVHTFPASCPSCTHPCNTHMKLVEIPHFKEVVIMSTVCDDCGYKSNEVKTGGEVSSLGRKITLKVEDADDLARDILKSETCALSVPELNLDLHPGTLGGRFTTLEGLLAQVHDELYGRVYSQQSDSMETEKNEKWQAFLDGLSEAREGKRQFTIILDDPLAASYLQNIYAPDPDPNMTTEDYERTHEQNEDLGLNDMVLEGYEDENENEAAKREAEEEAGNAAKRQETETQA